MKLLQKGLFCTTMVPGKERMDEMGTDVNRKELREAILAGERALKSLEKAKDQLDSARNWGVVDMLGGGSISGFVKHSRIRDASAKMDQAKRDLKIFQKELRDVDIPELRVEIGGFMTFADFFFDDFLVDFMVQRKINKARDQVEDAMGQTKRLLRKLKKY